MDTSCKLPSMKEASASLHSSLNYLIHATLQKVETSGIENVMGVDTYLSRSGTAFALRLAFGRDTALVAFRVKAETKPPYQHIGTDYRRLIATELSVHPMASSMVPVHETPVITVSLSHPSPHSPIDIPPYFFEALYRYEMEWREKLN